MTTIAIRGNTIAADSGIFRGYVCVGSITKLHRTKWGIYAGCGKTGLIFATLKWLMESAIDPEKCVIPSSLFDESTSGILLRPCGGVTKIDPGVAFRIEAPYHALGSGSDIALGAMWAGADAVDAVLAACSLDDSTRGPVVKERVS